MRLSAPNNQTSNQSSDVPNGAHLNESDDGLQSQSNGTGTEQIQSNDSPVSTSASNAVQSDQLAA